MAGGADIEITARAFWTDTEGGDHAVGFAASEDPEDGYVIFEGRPGDRKGLYLEVSDEIFAAKDAVEAVEYTAEGFVLTIRPAMQAKLGMVGKVAVFVAAGDAEGQAAIGVLKGLVA